MQRLAIGRGIPPRQQRFAGLVARLALVPLVDCLGGHHAGQVGALHLADRPRPGHQRVRVQRRARRDDAAHHAMRAQVAHNGARVHLGQHGDAAALEVVVGHLGGPPVGADLGELARHQRLDVGPRRFRIAGRRPIVPNVRIGQHHDLPRVRGIGEDLLVAGQRCIEDDFARGLDRRAEASSAKGAPVLKRQNCLHCLLLRNPIRSGFNRFYQHPQGLLASRGQFSTHFRAQTQKGPACGRAFCRTGRGAAYFLWWWCALR